jgi:hypothetical protein
MMKASLQAKGFVPDSPSLLIDCTGIQQGPPSAIVSTHHATFNLKLATNFPSKAESRTARDVHPVLVGRPVPVGMYR